MDIKDGLRIITAAGLPNPGGEFVKTSKDLKSFFRIKDYTGWTIRTAKLKHGPWKNIYINHCPKKDVPKTLDKMATQQKHDAIFAVYPSWKWLKCGTLLIDGDLTAIEANDKTIVNLMRGGEVTAGYYFTKGRLTDIVGKKNFLNKIEIKRILSAKKLKMNKVILEWAITTQKKFLFYKIEKLDEAGKLLLKKYS